MVQFNLEMLYLELVDLKWVSYAQPIPLSLKL